MKWLGVLLGVVLCVGIVGMAAAQEGDDPLEDELVEGEVVPIPLAEGLITLDGDLSDWANLPLYLVDYGTAISDSGTANPYFEFSVAADSQWLYVMATTPDDVIVAGAHGSNTWNEDSLEVYLNLTDDILATEYTPGIVQVVLSPFDLGNTDPGALTLIGTQSDTITVNGFMVETADGWGMEAAFSLADFEFEPEDGVEIGFNIQLNGATVQGADRDVKLIWSLWDTNDESWTDPSVFGSAMFIEVDAETYAPLVEGETDESVDELNEDDPYFLEGTNIEGEVVAIPLAEGLITLDGDLSDWEALPVSFVDYGPMIGESDTTNPFFEFSVAADSQWLYFMATTPDDVIVGGEHDTNTWNEDSFELYVNLTGDILAGEYAPGIVQVVLSAADIGNTDPAAITVTGVRSDTATVRAFVFETDDGWGVEAALSLADFGYVPEDGGEIGFNAHLNGATVPGGDRDIKLIWSLWDSDDQSWADPSVFGSGVFVDISE